MSDTIERYGSGTAAGVGFGNKTNPETSLDDYDNSEHRFGSHTNTDAYSGGHESFGSGATSGAGFGNKTTSNDTSEYDNSDLRTGSHSNTAPYSGGHPHHGSGTVGGAGFGNKTSDGYGTSDSTMGKVLEKAGNMLHSDGLAGKGRQRRELHGYTEGGESTADKLEQSRQEPY